MKIEKINYQRAYVTGPFLQDKLGIEISIDTDRGETPEAAYSWGKEIMDNWHKQNNPHLEGITITDAPGPPREIQIEKTPEQQRIADLIKDINSCKEVKVLESYRFIAKQTDELMAAYDNKMNELISTQ